MENITNVFTYNLQFPVFLSLFSLKYWLTRLLRVLKNCLGSRRSKRTCPFGILIEKIKP